MQRSRYQFGVGSGIGVADLGLSRLGTSECSASDQGLWVLGSRVWRCKGDGLALPVSDPEPQLWVGLIDLGMKLDWCDLGATNENLRARRTGVKCGRCAFDNPGGS